MNKEIKLLIKICKTNKSEFSADELAGFLNLKFTHGVYPYIRKLPQLSRKDKGIYLLNENDEKVRAVKLLQKIFGRYTEKLLSVHARRILERFSKKPILRSTELPQHNLKQVRDIAKNTKIIYWTRTGNSRVYFIRSWEEPAKELLRFFGIKLSFDEDEHRRRIIKMYSEFPEKQSVLRPEQDSRLAELNMRYYLKGEDYVLDRLENMEHPVLASLKAATGKKLKKLANPFEITKKINDWKIRYVYNTDKIEGNALTYEEVRTALTEGTEGIKREKKDILETLNSRTALDNIFDTDNELTVDFIKKLNRCVQNGISPMAGKLKESENCIVADDGDLIDKTTPAEFAGERLASMADWYRVNRKRFHPVALASAVHNQFLYIHPFDDGNGRVGRLIFNFILIKNGCFPVIFYDDEKETYYSRLRECKSGDMKPFIAFCSELYRNQLDLF